MLIRATFLEDLSGRTDFYGPIWMSVVFAVAIFVTNTACPLIWWHADHVPALSSLPSALTLVLSYIGLVSIGGWATLRWFGAETVKLGELAALFSYSLVICWPVIVSAAGVRVQRSNAHRRADRERSLDRHPHVVDDDPLLCGLVPLCL